MPPRCSPEVQREFRSGKYLPPQTGFEVIPFRLTDSVVVCLGRVSASHQNGETRREPTFPKYGPISPVNAAGVFIRSAELDRVLASRLRRWTPRRAWEKDWRHLREKMQLIQRGTI